MGRKAPPVSITMVRSWLALTGLPPTVGFYGKYLLFVDGDNAGSGWLGAAPCCLSVVSLFYYFRVVAAMFFSEAEGAPFRSSYALTAVLTICAAGRS